MSSFVLDPPPPEPCPDCRVGKHDSCAGYAIDLATDEIVPCPCREAGHGKAPEDD